MKNQFAGLLILEGIDGPVSFEGYEAYWNVESGEEWKIKDNLTYFFVACSVQLPLENKPRELCGWGDNKLDALKSLRQTVLVSLVMSECVHYFPERSLRDNLDSQEYLDGLKKHGIL